MNIGFKNTLSLHRCSQSQNEFNDCTVHAIANAWGIKYADAHEYAKRYFNRGIRAGVSLFDVITSLSKHDTLIKFPCINGYTVEFKGAAPKHMFWAHLVGDSKMLVNKRYPKGFNTEGERVYGAYTIGKFIKDHSAGRFFILVKGHACAIVDGILYDMPVFDHGGFKRPIQFAWQVK